LQVDGALELLLELFLVVFLAPAQRLRGGGVGRGLDGPAIEPSGAAEAEERLPERRFERFVAVDPKLSSDSQNEGLKGLLRSIRCG
jgi:hypothetical protein